MFCFYYLYIISIGGFVVLLVFAILSFANSEGMNIKVNRNIHSGVLLLMNSVMYLGCAILLTWYQRKNNRKRKLLYINYSFYV